MAQAVQNRLVALVLAMVAIVPLVAYPGGSIASVFAVEGFAVLLFAVLLWRARWNFTGQKLGAFLKTGPNIPILLFLGLVVGSCAFMRNEYAVQEALRIGAGIMLYFVIAYHFRRSEYLAKLFDTLLFVGIAVSLLGFGQLASGDAARAGGPFGNANLLGGFLMILLPIVAVIAVTEKSSWRQMTAQVATVLMIAAILVSQTRSAWLGMAAGLAVLGVLTLVAALRNRANNPLARKHEYVLPVMLVAAVGFFAIAWPQFGEVVNRASTLSTATNDGSLQWRQQAAQGALGMFLAHPLTGIGIGQYPLNAFGATNFGIPVGPTLTRPSMTENAHNLYLQTAAELGAPGLLLVGAILLAFLSSALYRVLRMDPGIRRSLLMGAIASVVAFSVDALSNPAWTIAQTSVFFWLVLGLGVGCLRPFERRRTHEVAQPVLSPRFMRPVAALGTLALAALLTTANVSADTPYRVKLDHMAISPTSSSIKSGLAQIYACNAWFVMSDGSISGPVDVTGAGTDFTKIGQGVMIGAAKNIYQSKQRTPETASITARYSYGPVMQLRTATLTVYR